MINVHPPRFSGAGALCTALALAWPCPTLAQDSLQVTFVGDRELYLREVDKPTDSPRAVDLGIDRPVIEYAPISKRTAPRRYRAPSPRLPSRWTPPFRGFTQGMPAQVLASIPPQCWRFIWAIRAADKAHGDSRSATAAQQGLRARTASGWMKAGPRMP